MNKEKRFGQIFTPKYLVEDILDFAGYINEGAILEKHIIDNSCGDGAFLMEIVCRYCAAYNKHSGDKAVLSQQLEKFIHGIELDPASYGACLENLESIRREMNLPPIKWDVRNADAMSVDAYDGKMDYVVGNPPYVRVHNLDTDFDRVKQYQFCGEGMTDLYLVFYEIGLKMLGAHGKLCYIAPSSWINSVAGKNMREYLFRSGCLQGIVDLQHFQAFNATTYTAITLLSREKSSGRFSYGVYDAPKNMRFVTELRYEDAFFDGALFLGETNDLKNLKQIKTSAVPSVVDVKNGFATLADDVFIADKFPFSNYLIPIVKASTGKWRMAFYPYDTNGKPIKKETIFTDKQVASYLEDRKEKLLKGRTEAECPDWYLYGRTQALKDVWTRKYAINAVVRDVASIKLNAVPRGAGVYSGLYIITDIPEEQLRAAIMCDDFIHYVSVLKKYKSGGYYTFNSRELAQYLNWKLSKMGCAACQ